MLKFLILLLVYLFTVANGVNILVLEELPSPSHHLWMKTLSTALAARGYNVTTLSADKDTMPVENLHSLHLEKVYPRIFGSVPFDYFEMANVDTLSELNYYYDFAFDACTGAIESQGWQKLLSYPDDFKFDLVIHDFPTGFCYLGFLQKFNYPPMISATAWNGVPMTAALYDTVQTVSISTFFTFNRLATTFVERFCSYAVTIIDQAAREFYVYPKMNKIVESSFKNLPPLSNLKKKSILSLLNYNAVIDGPQQLPPNVIGVGGLQIKAVKPLPKDLAKILDDETKRGAILFSLGTNLKFEELGDNRVTEIMKALARFPDYTILCKVNLENYTLPVPLPKNVVIRKWLPQNDILAHKNVKLFVTHGGLLSFQESVWHAVPMVGLPAYVDQFQNMHRAALKNIADSLLWDQLTATILYEKIQNILTNPQVYQENIEKASKAFRDEKEPPLDRAIWWVEWVLRNPNATHFKAIIGQDLNFLQLQSIDVIAVMILFLLIILWILNSIVKLVVCNLCCRSGKQTNVPQQKRKNKKE